jgi:hypothetical protein
MKHGFCDVVWYGKVYDGLEVSLTESDLITGDLKAGKLNLICPEDKLLWVKCYTIPSTNVNPTHCLEETFF